MQFDEFRQSATHTRLGSPLDVVIDAIGVALFLWLAGAFKRKEKLA